MRDDFRGVLREGIDQTYQTFLERVAEGRKMTRTRADSLAQGRVWTGQQALENGLIDGLGGMPEALEMAAEMAEITDFKLKILPRFKTGLERLMEDLGGGQMSTEQLITAELGPEWGQTLIALKQIFEQEGIQARLPFTLNIK